MWLCSWLGRHISFFMLCNAWKLLQKNLCCEWQMEVLPFGPRVFQNSLLVWARYTDGAEGFPPPFGWPVTTTKVWQGEEAAIRFHFPQLLLFLRRSYRLSRWTAFAWLSKEPETGKSSHTGPNCGALGCPFPCLSLLSCFVWADVLATLLHCRRTCPRETQRRWWSPSP